MTAGRETLIVCGLMREVATLPWPHIIAAIGGGRRPALERRLSAVDPTDVGSVVSFGFAGALSPGLAPGDAIVPREVRTSYSVHPTSSDLVEGWLRAAARGTLAIASREPIYGADTPAATRAEKASLRQASEAVAVDMESHVAAEFAARHGLPFGILRVISDAAHHDVPPAVIAAMREDGSLGILPFLGSLVRHPSQLPALAVTGWSGMRASSALVQAGRLLQPRLDDSTG